MTISKQLVAFHGDPAIKEKYVNRVMAHQKADKLIRGVGWEDGRGCAVGCTLESYDHSRYPLELGIPEWLAQVEDTLFEKMGKNKSKTWPEKFLKAIPVGSNLEPIKAKFLIMVLESVLTCFDHAKYPEIKSAVDGSIKLWTRKDIGSASWNKAATAATAARAEKAEVYEQAAAMLGSSSYSTYFLNQAKFFIKRLGEK